MNKVICVILNYNDDENSRKIYNSINCEKYIVDSSFCEKEGMIQSDKPFYTGNFNKASELFLKSDADYCFYVCADIVGDINIVIDHIKHIDGNIGVYSPQVSGRRNKYWYDTASKKGKGIVDAICCEGMAIAVKRYIIELVHPFWHNTYGWEIDAYKCFTAKEFGYRVVIDNSISVFHPNSVGYDTSEALNDMKLWRNIAGYKYRKFVRSLSYPFYIRCWLKLINLLNGNCWKL